MKQYQKTYLLLSFFLLYGEAQVVSAQGESCNSAIQVSNSPGIILDVSFGGESYRWLTLTVDTPGMELEFSPDDQSDFANIESIDLYSGNDCSSKALLGSQNYVDSDSLHISSKILMQLPEAGTNYFLKVNRLPGYGNGFKLVLNLPNLMGGCTPVCPNIINNPDFATFNSGCVNWSSTHACPDPFNQGCICAWRSSHGTPNFQPGQYASMGVYKTSGEGIYQNLSSNVIAGRNYFLSFNYKSDSPANNYAFHVQLGNSNFTPGPCFGSMPFPDWDIPNTPVGPNPVWTNVIRCFTANANYSMIRFYPTSNANITQWVGLDNVKLFEIDAPIPDQTINCNEMAILSQPCPSLDPHIQYLWSTGQTNASIVVYPSVTTTYTLTISIVDNGQTLCSYNIPTTVYVNPLPVPTLTVGANTFCNLSSTGTYCFSSVGAYQFNFTSIPPNPMVPGTSCVDVTWNNLNGDCGTIEVAAIANACTSSASFQICLKCKGNPASLTFCDALASDILGDPQYASYISGGNIFKVPPGQWATFHGTFTVDVPFVFDNSDVRFGADAKVSVNPSQVFEVINHSHLHSCDGINMWKGIYTMDPSALVYIHDGNNLVEDAGAAIWSENGGNFQVNSTTFKNNFIGIMVGWYNGAHPGKVWGCTFTGTGTLLSPYNSWCSMEYPQCGIRVHDVKQIQLGEPAYYNTYGRNIFQSMFSGIYCSISNVDIYTSEFNNMIDPPGLCMPPEGCGIYAYGNTGLYNEVNVGDQAPSQQCIFNFCTYGIRERLDVHGEIKYNKFMECENAITNQFSSRLYNLVKGNVIDNFKRGVYFYNAINQLQYGLEIVENLFNTNMTSYNMFTYGGQAINVTNSYSASSMLWITGNVINYSKVGIFARNVWEPCNIRSNTINFDILPADVTMMGVHHGIQCENDNGLQIDNNNIRWRNQPTPPSGFINKMNGITINYSTTTIANTGGIFENKIGPYPASNTGSTYGMGSGINISSDCQGLYLYCNKLNRCQEGVTLNNANLGRQGYQDHWTNWYSNGNTFVYTPGQGGIYRIGGTVFQSIDWPYVNANEDPNPFHSNIITPLPTTFSSYHCMPPAPLAEDERDEVFGMLISNDELPLNPDYSGYEEQIRYSAKEKFYASVKEDATILNAGVAEDLVYVDLFDDLENSNIAKIQDIKTSFDSLDFTDATQKLSLLVDTNLAEYNKKIVMGVFLETSANDLELDSVQIALLEPISMLHPLIGGEGVFWACAMLDKPVNNELPPLRKANPNCFSTGSGITGIRVFPNPASDEIQILYHSESVLTLTITDVTGKVILDKYLDNRNEIEKVNTSKIESGIYLLKVANNSKAVFTEKLNIIR
jgi:hypothetical protein